MDALLPDEMTPAAVLSVGSLLVMGYARACRLLRVETGMDTLPISGTGEDVAADYMAGVHKMCQVVGVEIPALSHKQAASPPHFFPGSFLPRLLSLHAHTYRHTHTRARTYKQARILTYVVHTSAPIQVEPNPSTPSFAHVISRMF
jgi:hypothetical protein